MPTMEEIGKRMKELRGNTPRGIVAPMVGVSVSALQMYEDGKRMPRDDVKVTIAKYYNTTVGWLFFNEEEHKTCTYTGE